MTTQAAPLLPARRWFEVTPASRTHRALLATSLAGGIVFTAAYTIDGLLTSGYNAVKQPISSLGIGPTGWIQQVNFVVFGLVALASAVGIRAALAPGRAATWAPLLRVLGGLATIVVGFFVTDPVGVTHPTAHGMVHTFASYVSLMATVAYLIVLGCRFAIEPNWRGWAIWSFGTAAVMIVSLAAFGAALGTHGPAGVFERIASTAPVLIGIGIVVRLLRGTCQISTS